MKYINTFRNKDGSYTSTEWTADEMFNASLIEYVIKIFMIALISLIASAICMFARIYDYEENEKAPSIWGIIISIYFIIDYKYQLILHFFISFFSGIPIESFAKFNSALLLTHILLLIFGDTVYYHQQGSERDKKIYLSIWVIASLFITYIISSIIIF